MYGNFKGYFFHENLSGVLAYNFKWNKACIVDKDIYNYLKENQCGKLLSILSEDMLNMLINNGILIDDYQNYKNKIYYPNAYRKQLEYRLFACNTKM